MIQPLRKQLPAPSLLDGRNRALRDIRISLTDHCNLRCTYCMPKEVFGAGHSFLPETKLLTFDEITALVRVLAELGVQKVKLTGGEPLTRPFLPRLVQMIREAAPDVEVNLITNGTLLAPVAQRLKDAGLDRLTVSLDSLSPERFATISGRGRQLDKVLAGIEAGRDAGFRPIKINMVVIRGVNDDEVERMAAHFRRPDTILRFIEYMDVGTCNGWRRTEVVGAAEILARLRKGAVLEPVGSAYRGETAKRYRYGDGSGEIGFIASVTQPFCGDCSRLRLSADGKIFGCLFSKDGLDIKSSLRGDGGVARARDAIETFWRRRRDQYSVERPDELTEEGREKVEKLYKLQMPPEARKPNKIEMSYIGG